MTADRSTGSRSSRATPDARPMPTEPIAEAVAVLWPGSTPPTRSPSTCRSTTIEPAVTTGEATTAAVAAERVTARHHARRRRRTLPIATRRSCAAGSRSRPTDGRRLRGRSSTRRRSRPRSRAWREDGQAGRSTPRSRRAARRITGVTASKDGYTLDVQARSRRSEALLARARTAGATGPTLEPALAGHKPALTTDAAQAAIRRRCARSPSGRRYFPITREERLRREHLDPGADDRRLRRRAAREVRLLEGRRARSSRAKGYRQGGAIINGRTEPQGALAGGICSCSTTLFNAALRAGLRDGRPAQPLLLHRSLPARPRRDGVHQRLRLGPDDVLDQRHGLPGPHPRLQDPRRQPRLRQVRAVQRADRPQGVDRRGRRSGTSGRPATASSTRSSLAPGATQADRVPGRRQAGLADGHRSRTRTASSSTARPTTRTTRASPASSWSDAPPTSPREMAGRG